MIKVDIQLLGAAEKIIGMMTGWILKLTLKANVRITVEYWLGDPELITQSIHEIKYGIESSHFWSEPCFTEIIAMILPDC